LFAGGWAIQQLWLFWAAPILGAALGALLYGAFAEETPSKTLAKAA
jgi:aquaporin Z